VPAPATHGFKLITIVRRHLLRTPTVITQGTSGVACHTGQGNIYAHSIAMVFADVSGNMLGVWLSGAAYWPSSELL
jgi:hypothetical protein